MEFKDRLLNFRESLETSKRNFAKKIELSESYYNLIESGKREPSKAVLAKLVLLSNKPEEYWLYGVETEKYIEVREEFKCTKKAIEQLIELGILKDSNQLFTEVRSNNNTIDDLVLTALKADIQHMIDKNIDQEEN